MGPFDYLFSFYGLLLGIAVANVAIGFADMWRDSERIGVGTCPPLLACVVLLGGMNVWLTTWQTRHDVGVSGWQMLAAAGIALPYVFVSRAMFPGEEKEPESSLEDHYLKHRVLILAMLTVPPVVGAVSRALLDDIHEYGLREAWMTVRIAAPLLLMPFRARKVQRAGLGGFVVLELVGLFRGGKPRRRRGKGMSGRTAAGPFHSAVPPKSSREGGTDKLEFTQLRLAAGMGKWFTKINFLGGRATEEMAVFRSSSEQSLAGDVAQR